MDTGRYNRQTKLAGLGPEGQQKLAAAKVLVVGAGGLGVPVLQYLTAMGIGTIGVIDGDKIKLDNLHRQVLYDEASVGKLKVQVAVRKLDKLNSSVRFLPHTDFLTAGNALALIKDYDLVIDASDNFGTRYLINDACVMLNKPFVYGAVQQFEGHVAIFNHNGGPTYRCLYPQPPAQGEIPDCNTAGVLGVAPGIIGSQQALQAVKLLTGLGSSLSGYLQVFDLLNDEQYKIKLKPKPENKLLANLQDNYNTPDHTISSSIQVEQLFKLYADGKPFLLLDVREPREFETEHLSFARSFPLSSIKQNTGDLPVNIPLITICEIGGRSARAATLLKEMLPGTLVRNVSGGMEAWFDQLGEQLVVYPEKATT